MFKKGIAESRPYSTERKKIVELLKEWLCAYYEVMAVHQAQKIARERGGQLVYLDINDQPQQAPPLRPFTSGHIDTQNQTHVLQNVRWYLGQKIAREHKLSEDEVYFPKINVDQEIDRIREDDNALSEVIKDRRDGITVKLSAAEEAKRIVDGEQESSVKKRKANDIIKQNKSTFFSSQPTNKRKLPENFDSQPKDGLLSMKKRIR